MGHLPALYKHKASVIYKPGPWLCQRQIYGWLIFSFEMSPLWVNGQIILQSQ